MRRPDSENKALTNISINLQWIAAVCTASQDQCYQSTDSRPALDTPAASLSLHGKHWCLLHFSFSDSHTALIGPGLEESPDVSKSTRPVQNTTGRTGRRQTCCSSVSFTGKEQRHEHLQRLHFFVSTLESQQLCLHQLCVFVCSSVCPAVTWGCLLAAVKHQNAFKRNKWPFAGSN